MREQAKQILDEGIPASHVCPCCGERVDFVYDWMGTLNKIEELIDRYFIIKLVEDEDFVYVKQGDKVMARFSATRNNIETGIPIGWGTPVERRE